jgi:hypothetical protein
MRKLPLLLLLLVGISDVVSSVQLSHSPAPNLRDSVKFAVEAVQVAELPISVRDVVLTKTRRGFELKCLLSNNSAERIVRLDYLLLVIDSNNVTRHMLNGTEDFKLKGYAVQRLVSETHLQLEVGDGYRLFLMPNRVSGREYVWEVLKANKALETYAAGDYSLRPEVVRVLNLYDAPPRSRIIY